MQYTIIGPCGLIELEERVQFHIDNGWRPQGGVVVTSTFPNELLQAMIKHEEIEY